MNELLNILVLFLKNIYTFCAILNKIVLNPVCLDVSSGGK